MLSMRVRASIVERVVPSAGNRGVATSTTWIVRGAYARRAAARYGESGFAAVEG